MISHRTKATALVDGLAGSNGYSVLSFFHRQWYSGSIMLNHLLRRHLYPLNNGRNSRLQLNKQWVYFVAEKI